MNISLKGQHVLVTGGSRGIGKAISRQMHQCGAKVAIQYYQNENAAKSIADELGNRVELFQADLSNAMEVASLYERVLHQYKRINLIVNNAGIALHSPVEDDPLNWTDAWLKTMDVNLNAVGLLCKLSIDHYQQVGGGRIINISSRAAFRGDTADYLAYAASKGGVVALTRSIARAFGKQNIIAFNIAPGFVRTDMAKDFMNKYGDAVALNDISLNKLTEPEDIAPLIAFLASGMADHATGGTFDINAASYVH